MNSITSQLKFGTLPSFLTGSVGKSLLIASIALTIIFALGAIVNYFNLAHYFYNRNTEVLNPEPNRVPPSLADDQSSVLLQQFISQMNRTMGPHLHSYQKTTLINLFYLAMANPYPRQTMDRLISEKINQPGGWGVEKAEKHIKVHLLGLMPVGSLSVKKIASTPINPQGDLLVCFYKIGPTEFLGNFAQCPSGIAIFGHTFKCSEAAFQWRKFYLAAIENGREDMQQDANMMQFFTCNGEEAFGLRKYFDGHYPNVYVNGWKDGVRDQVMWQVLHAKFTQNQEFKGLLDDTSPAYLLEHNPKKIDDHWSDNHDGSGKNMLGKMLMAIRDNQPCPSPNDRADDGKVQFFADSANFFGALNYQIF